MEYDTPPEVIEAAERVFRELPREQNLAMAELLSTSYRNGRKRGRSEASQALALLAG